MIARAAEIQTGAVARVGVNTCQIPEEQDTILRDVVETRIEPCLDRIERVREFKKTRDQDRVRTALGQLRSATVKPAASLMEPLLSALEADATLGELSGAMRMAYGMPYDPLSNTPAPF
jgi:methylmalonyl-CoA mutase N-terminal domain/subunit